MTNWRIRRIRVSLSRLASGIDPELFYSAGRPGLAGEAQPQLLERDTELRALGAAVERAVNGAGQTILIEGPAGAGKSALMTAAGSSVAGREVRVLRASGSELEREHAFGAVRQLFEPVLTGGSARDRKRLLAGAAAPAGWVIDPAGDLDTTRTRSEAGFAVLHAIYWLAANLAAPAPLLIAVDDLHWVDESSLRSLNYLARRISDLPIALLVTLRPSEPGSPLELLDELRTLPDAGRIVPSPLGPVSVSRMVRARIPEAGEELCAAFHEASAGNPLYLRELLLSAAEDFAAEPGAPDTIRRASVPALAERLSRRIARVAPDAEGLATAMAVLGDGGSLRLAAALASIDDSLAAGIAHQLTEIEVLSSDDPFAFAHPVLRRSVYDRLTVAEREAAHSRAADLLRESGAGPETIAAHVSKLGPAGSDAVATVLTESARRALSRAAPDAAVRLLRRALAEQAAEPPRVALLFELGKAEMAMRDPTAIAHLQEALELAEDPELRGRIGATLSELLAAAGQWDAALDVIATAKRAVGGRAPELLAELESVRAVGMANDPRLVHDFERERERFSELSKSESWAAHALAAVLANVAALRCEGSATAMVMVERALTDGRLIGERGGGGWAAAQLLPALVSIEEYDRALEVSGQVVAEGRRTGSLLGVITGMAFPGIVFDRTGDLAAAEAVLRTVVSVIKQSGMVLWLVSVFHAFCDTLLERPKLAKVAELMDTIDLDPVFASTTAGAMLLEARGRVALARQDRGRALEDLRACAETSGALGFGPTHSPWRSALALALPAGERERADSLVAEELSLGRASGLARPEGVALRTAGLLEGGEKGIGLLRDSALKLEDSPARLEHARSLVELGAALRRRQRRGEAREHLSAGMELAHRCGADRLVTRADEELRAAGARPRRPARSGIDALTASELRVARLVAAGRSNPEVAQELYVSTKTVETHLSHAYSKLGLSGPGSRGRLTEVLAA